jgi:hypothetical protein
MASTRQKSRNKRLYFLQFGHFETNPDEITAGTYKVGTEVYDMTVPQLIFTDAKQLKRMLTKLVSQYEKFLKQEKR